MHVLRFDSAWKSGLYLSSFDKCLDASYTIRELIFADVSYCPPYSTDKFISCIVPDPSQWFFHFGEEIIIAWTQEENDDTILVVQKAIILNDNERNHTASLLLSRTSCAAGNGRFWNSHRTHPIWVHAIAISSPKWKNHCKGPGTTQEINLSVL